MAKDNHITPTLKERTLTMTHRVCGFMSVKDLRTDAKCIRKLPIVYRWWFPKDSLIVNYILQHYPNPKGIKDIEELLPRLKTKEIEGNLYYALYLGQSGNGQERFRQHYIGKSTLRKTIATLCFADVQDKREQEMKISALLDTCYFEWIDFLEDAELVETIEAQCIAVGCYPLNMDANRSIDEKWIAHVMEQRKKIND